MSWAKLEAHITLHGRRADGCLLYPRWERRIGSERVAYREDRDRPLSPRGMHQWFAERLQEADVDHFPMHELRHTAGTSFTGRFAGTTGTFTLHSIVNQATGVSSGTLSGAIEH